MATSISTIDELNSVENFCESYSASLDIIHQYGMSDIQDTLEKQDMSKLMILHKMLAEHVQQEFPEYKDKRVINRQVKSKAVTDIITMGLSVVNKLPTKDLDSVFVHKKAQDVTSSPDYTLHTLDTTEFSQLLISVANMKRDLDMMKDTVEKLKEENKSLSEQIKSSYCNCPSNCSQPSAPLAATSPSSSPLADTAPSTASLAATALSSAPLVATTPSSAPLTTTTPPSAPLAATTPSSALLAATTPLGVSLVATAPGSAPPVAMVPSIAPLAATALSSTAPTSNRGRPRLQRTNTSSSSSYSSSDSEDDFVMQRWQRKAEAQRTRQSQVAAAPTLHTRNRNFNRNTTVAESIIYIGKVSASTSIKDIKKHIKNIGVTDNVFVKCVRDKQDWKSFSVATDASSAATILSRNAWPSGIIVQPFRGKKTANTNIKKPHIPTAIKAARLTSEKPAWAYDRKQKNAKRNSQEIQHESNRAQTSQATTPQAPGQLQTTKVPAHYATTIQPSTLHYPASAPSFPPMSQLMPAHGGWGTSFFPQQWQLPITSAPTPYANWW